MTDCKKCGDCCRFITLPLGWRPDQFIIEWLLARGTKPRVNKQNKLLYVEVSYPCPHLKDNECEIYEKRPMVCRNGKCLHEESV